MSTLGGGQTGAAVGSWSSKMATFKVETTPTFQDVNLPTLLDDMIGKGELNGDQETVSNHVWDDVKETRDWVAVVGMACRFPEADSLEEYWNVFMQEQITCNVAPTHRTRLIDTDPSLKANFLKCPIDLFDCGFFGVSPTEAAFTDPQSRILMEVTWEAFEDAGINPEGWKGSKAGVFHGSWSQDYREALNCASSPTQDYSRKYLGNGFGSAAAKLSYFYGFTGPNISTESACSSSMVALDLAVKSLGRQECPVALVTGSNLVLFKTKQPKVLAADGLSKTFDVKADGYSRSEGIAVLILKRYSDAVQDKDRIHAIIRGTATGQEGLSKSLGTPTVETEVTVMREALVAAKVDPCQVDYVEAHATGTSVGDPIEAAAIVQAYSSQQGRPQPLWIGSGKTNIGHTEACSGLAGIFKVILSMKHGIIPRHVNLTKMNPLVDFSLIPGAVPLQTVPWPRNPDRVRIAGVSSFGITGTAAHVIIQEPPHNPQHFSLTPASKTGGVLALSAKSEAALNQLSASFQTYLSTTPASLDDILFSSNACRPHHPLRRAVLGRDKNEIIAHLQSPQFMPPPPGKLSAKKSPAQKNGVCFVFPGISVKDMSSFSSLYHSTPYLQKIMGECDSLFQQVTGRASLLPLLHPTNTFPTGTLEEWYTLFPLSQYCLAKLWMHWGVQPGAVLGHSAGELAAALVCGALTLEDYFGFSLPVARHLLQSATDVPAHVLVLKVSRAEVEALIQQFFNNNLLVDTVSRSWIDVAGENSPTQTVVVSPPDTMGAFQEFCLQRDIQGKLLHLDFCAHSRAVQRACQRSLQHFKVPQYPMKLPFISSYTGEIIPEGGLTPSHWYHVFRDCVQYRKACSTVKEAGLATAFLEMGLSAYLSKNTQENLDNPAYLFLATFPKTGILTSLGQLYTWGVDVNWNNFHNKDAFYSQGGQRVPLPGYPFQRRSCWFEGTLSYTPKKAGLSVLSLPTNFPLLGARLNVVGENVMFYKDPLCSVDDPQTRFIMDHVFESKVVFPGAGYLEIFTAAWRQSAVGDTEEGLVTLKNFKIFAPLFVEDSSRVQCSLHPQSGNASIYSSQGTPPSPWRLQASGHLESVPWLGASLHPLQEQLVTSIRRVLENDSGGQSKAMIDTFYNLMVHLGYNFGKSLLTFTRICKGSFLEGSQAEGDLIIEFRVQPQDLPFLDHYFCHPVLTDAMFQGMCVNLLKPEGPVYVPVSVGTFTVFPPPRFPKRSDQWYLFCRNAKKSVYLFDENYKMVALMEQVDLIATSMEAVLTAAENKVPPSGRENSKIRSVPLYEEFWKKVPSGDPAGERGAFSEGSKVPPKKEGGWIICHFGVAAKRDVDEFIPGYMEAKTGYRVDLTPNQKEDTAELIKCQVDRAYEEGGTLEGVIYWINGRADEVNIGHSHPKSLLEPLLASVQHLLARKPTTLPKFLLVTNDREQYLEGARDDVRPGLAMGTAVAFLRSIRTEIPGFVSKWVEVEEREDRKLKMERVGRELGMMDKEGEVKYREGERFVRRLRHLKTESTRLDLPASNYVLQLPRSKVIKEVKLVPSTARGRGNDSLESDREVRVEVRSVSLNFKDVLAVMKPSREFDHLTGLGQDFSGVVSHVAGGVTKWKVGEAVMGHSWRNGSIQSVAAVEEEELLAVPDNMTFAEAATLPSVFYTVWYSMVTIAGLQAGQTVLVHAASGGVGLIAIQIASLLKVEVIATAGNERKRGFLKTLGVKHVFNSRSLDFAPEVKAATGGRGVDMVLNCLTGPGFKEATLEVCRDGGHFVEISKLDIWREEQVQERRPLVKYTVVDITEVGRDFIERMSVKLAEFMSSGRVKPLFHVTFPLSRLIDALTLLQHAKHIGKVVVNFPARSNPTGEKEQKELLFNDRSCYIITGGKGAIGFGVCEWMIREQGAKYVVLVGRREASELVAQGVVDLERECGAIIKCKQMDIADYQQCEALIRKDIPKWGLPPLRGIHHCAGLMSDKMIGQQDWDNFEKVLRPKAEGAWNFHRLTSSLPLEHFVLYSSGASTFGNVGQSNYVAANAYLDALAQYRQSACLPVLSINWGQWSVGMAEGLKVDWARPFSLKDGIRTLEQTMKDPSLKNVVAGHFNFSNILKTHAHYKHTFLEDLALYENPLGRGNAGTEAESDPNKRPPSLMEQLLQLEDSAQKQVLIKEFLLKLLCETLGTSPEDVPDNVPFSDLGMDSLLSVEFVNKILDEMGDTVAETFIDLEDNGSLGKLVKLLSSILIPAQK